MADVPPIEVPVTAVVTQVGPLATPDPIRTTESYAAVITTILPALIVLFKLHVSDTDQAAAITVLGAVLTGFTLWHAKGIRAARAIAQGLAVAGRSAATTLNVTGGSGLSDAVAKAAGVKPPKK